ncbi:hypothetical protein BOX15_Mlig025326g4 [Macrostomum lignano]|uniref:Major facilitator superfamily (MFS) profile domain-containing protein n=1 Tax=Macrostomum lignano TaxID=282301 RepID=A0A267H2V1_9PLAT|nr:hypothetical protein BOX15_Mlig025326g4 [Macrostomum lignano]
MFDSYHSDEAPSDERPLISDDAASAVAGKDGDVDIETALDQAGYGRLHLAVMSLCAWACTSDAVEIVCVSFILPAAECDLGLTSFDKGALNAVIFAGMLVGGLLWGAAGDAVGRRATLIWSLTVNATGGLASCLAPNFWTFLALRFLSGLGVGGSYPVIFSYYSEWQSRRRRGAAVAALSCCWMLGGLITAAGAWLVVPRPGWTPFNLFGGSVPFHSWRLFVALCSLPSLTSAALFPCVPESPKYLLQMGRVDEATALMNRVAAGNGIQEVPAFSRVFMRSSVSRPPRSRMGRCAQMLRSLLDLFSRRHRRPVLLLIGVQFSLAFGYYGLLLWFPELFKRVEAYGGSACSLGSGVNGSSTFNDSDSNACDPQVLSASRPYMESFLVNASNLPGNLLSIVLMDRLGRRTILSASMLLTAVSVFLVATVRVQWQALALSCAFAGLSASGWNALGVVSTELLPTGLRSTALGVSGALSRVASLLSNLMFGALIDAGCAGPLISAAGLMTLGSLLACLFPNTTGVSVL